MKKFYGAILLCSILIAIYSPVKAQPNSCAGLTAELINQSLNNTQFSYSAKVTIQNPYSQNLFVKVTIYEVGNIENNVTHTLVILPGQLTAESPRRTLFNVSILTGAYVVLTDYIACDPHFLNVAAIDNQITALTDTSYGEWTETEYQSFLSAANGATNLQDLITIYQQAGITNASQIVSLFEQKTQELIYLLETNQTFVGLTSTQKQEQFNLHYSRYRSGTSFNYLTYIPTIIFSESLFDQSVTMVRNTNTLVSDDEIEIEKEITPIIMSNQQNEISIFNECSDSYRDGMENCDDNFAVETGASLLAGAFALLATPIASALTISSGIGVAYIAEIACRKNVVKAWRICRR